jgi:hypothetical protein
MKVPHLRFIAAAGALAAIMAGASATAADAATTSVSHSAITAATPSPGSITSAVTGTFTNADGTGTFAGTFAPKSFSVVNGTLEATGLLKGTLTDANGTVLGTVSQTVTDSIATGKAANAPAACGILDLTLGPLNLNLLGLVVQLNQVHLTITAVPGAGNLLGNLLCSLTGLLNGGGLLSEISALLNQILALL